jgi:hypothetical protein
MNNRSISLSILWLQQKLASPVASQRPLDLLNYRPVLGGVLANFLGKGSGVLEGVQVAHSIPEEIVWLDFFP